MYAYSCKLKTWQQYNFYKLNISFSIFFNLIQESGKKSRNVNASLVYIYKQLQLAKRERTLGIVHLIALVNRSIEYIYQQYPYSSFLLKTINM